LYPELQGRVAVVTGAGRRGGLGAAIAARFAREGARVVLHDLGATQGEKAPAHGVGQRAELLSVAEEIGVLGRDVATFAGDMRVEADVEALMQHAVATFGRVDILTNNAGVGCLFGPLLEMSQERWATVHGVNPRGAFFAIKLSGRQMVQQASVPGWGRGRIVSIASKAAKSASLHTGAYVASRHGLVGLTRAAAIERGPREITDNAVCPNLVTTGLGTWQIEFTTGKRGLSADTYPAATRGRIPLGRVGRVEDSAKACAFLRSSPAQYLTGKAIKVSGGEENH
jgi:meso-butanediol dehydrogenase/(S,S)-butanediol dehydrogenase/diacetyl reductase